MSNSSWQARPWANLKTTVGTEYNNVESDFVASSGTQLPPGAQNVGQGAVKTGSNQLQTANKTLGLYAQEQAGIPRSPLHHRRGSYRPELGVRHPVPARVLSEAQRVVAALGGRLLPEVFVGSISSDCAARTAPPGQQPGATTALQTFSAVTRTINATTPGNATGTDTPSLLAAALGNPNLKPETSAEVEGGFESRMFNNRASLDFTVYHKKTTDALIAQPIAGSAAPSALSVTRNLGSVMNEGLEALVNFTVLDRKSFGWDVTLNGSHNTNKILSLGRDANGNANPTIGTGTTRDSVGLPANGWFFQPVHVQ